MKVSRNYLNKPHRIYGGGGNILKGGDIPRVFATHPWGAIFLGYSPPGGAIPKNIAPFLRGWSNLRWGELFKNSIFPPPNISLPLKCPPPPNFGGLAPPLVLSNVVRAPR